MVPALLVSPVRTLREIAARSASTLPLGILLLLAYGLSRPDELARTMAQLTHGPLAALSMLAQRLLFFFGPELLLLGGAGALLGLAVVRAGGKRGDHLGAALYASVPSLLLLALGGGLRQAFPELPQLLAPVRNLSPASLARGLALYLPALLMLAAHARAAFSRASPPPADGPSSGALSRADRFGGVVFLSVAAVGTLLVVLSVLSRWDRVKPPASGEAPPELTFPLLGGGETSLAALRGKVVIVDFWATWCPPCVESMPNLEAVAAARAGDGLVALAVNRDDRQEQARAVPAFLLKHKLSHLSVVLDDGSAAAAFRVQVLPTLYILDRRGRIAATHVGGLDREELEELVAPLLAEKAEAVGAVAH